MRGWVFSAFWAWQKSCSCPIFRTQPPLPFLQPLKKTQKSRHYTTLCDTILHDIRLKICYCSWPPKGYSRFALFLFLGRLQAPIRNIPERVWNTMRTFPDKNGKRPCLETTRFTEPAFGESLEIANCRFQAIRMHCSNIIKFGGGGGFSANGFARISPIRGANCRAS